MEAGPRDTAHEEQGQLSPEGHAGLPGQGGDDLPGPGADEPADRAAELHAEDGVVVPDGPDPEEEAAALAGSEVEVELRPQRKLRIWQIAPIVVLATLGSLMFAFPLAFEFGDGGAVVAMLGLLISCCAAGWGVMAARRVGHTWPGLPARGSGHRPDWRVVLAYTAVVGVLAVLAVWRVARLR
ncbi:hypothetical protein SAMN05421806_106267 [Streptomyces indicus]|uniref:Transmembrane protein n=2 Tax=Streptomyces indicus TaxID=417292 RepID=A0A1G9B0Q7_9ACTN|nr:hypothetical protein [Streptomyces indicus]SDK33166.1 hypothetical protein SAMN05421806_106267 [Streptomyces indicus]